MFLIFSIIWHAVHNAAMDVPYSYILLFNQKNPKAGALTMFYEQAKKQKFRTKVIMNLFYLHIHFSCPFLIGHALQTYHNIGHLIFIFLVNQEAFSPPLHFELSLGYSRSSYQNYKAWKNLARHCKIRKTDSEGYKRTLCAFFARLHCTNTKIEACIWKQMSP